MSANIVEVTDSSFEQEVLQCDLPVLVDFGRPGAVLVVLLPLSLKNFRPITGQSSRW